MAIIQKEESEPDAIKSLLAQVAEGQKRMEENRADSGEVDQLGPDFGRHCRRLACSDAPG